MSVRMEKTYIRRKYIHLKTKKHERNYYQIHPLIILQQIYFYFRKKVFTIYKYSMDKSLRRSILDTPVPDRKIKFFPSGSKLKPLKSKLVKLLPEPLKPTKYVEKPIPKPRKQKKTSSAYAKI